MTCFVLMLLFVPNLLQLNLQMINIFVFAGRYFNEISQDTGKYCFGVEDALPVLELGSVEILIVSRPKESCIMW